MSLNTDKLNRVPMSPLASAQCSADRRDGVEAAAAEIVMLYVGFPSLSEHERVCGIIRKEITQRGIRQPNKD